MKHEKAIELLTGKGWSIESAANTYTARPDDLTLEVSIKWDKRGTETSGFMLIAFDSTSHCEVYGDRVQDLQAAIKAAPMF